MIAANALAHDYHDIKEGINKDRDEIYDDWQLRRNLSQSNMYNSAGEGPSVLQLGGSDPQQLYVASKVIYEAQQAYCDYTALNLNCGCPSPKVAGKGCFGAALMHEPELVRTLTKAMHEGSQGTMPITVKCRIGTDSIQEENLYSNLCRFIETVASGSIVQDFQIHARIAILSRNISPAKNRSIPPLKYNLVHRLAEDYPQLRFSLNGGINSLFEAKHQFDLCPKLSGVMVGRSMAAQPWHWSAADSQIFQGSLEHSLPNRWEILQQYASHANEEEAIWGNKIRRFILKALQSLFHGEPNARKFRIALDEIGAMGKLDSTMSSGLSLGTLILDAAQKTLSEEVLTRTRAESFELALLERHNIQKNPSIDNERSAAIIDWQEQRREEARNDSMLH